MQKIILDSYTFSSSTLRNSQFNLAFTACLPWVPEVFLACGGNFRCWPKAEATSAGTQGTACRTSLYCVRSIGRNTGKVFGYHRIVKYLNRNYKHFSRYFFLKNTKRHFKQEIHAFGRLYLKYDWVHTSQLAFVSNRLLLWLTCVRMTLCLESAPRKVQLTQCVRFKHHLPKK